MSARDSEERPAPDALRRFDERRGIAKLWYGLLVGIFAWKLYLMVTYALVPWACWYGLQWLIHLATLLTIALSLSGAVVGLLNWRRAGPGGGTEEEGVIGRSRFMALSAIALGIFFAFIIFGQWLPNLMLGACDGIS